MNHNPVRFITPDTESLGIPKPGDIIRFKPGRFTRSFELKDVAGSAAAPIVVEAAEAGKTVFDGSESIELEWEREEGNVFRATCFAAPHGLCLNERMLVHNMAKGPIPRVSSV